MDQPQGNLKTMINFEKRKRKLKTKKTDNILQLELTTKICMKRKET